MEMLTYQQKGKKTVCEEGVEDFFCGFNTCFFCCCVAATKMQAPTQHKRSPRPTKSTKETQRRALLRCAKKTRSSTRERERERLGFRSKS
jgi:hypothetical protein